MSDRYAAITTRPRSSARGTRREEREKMRRERRNGAELRKSEERENTHAGSKGRRVNRGRKHARGVTEG